MRLKLITAVLLFLSVSVNAQRPKADKIQTNKGNLTVQPILHGTLMLQWDRKTIYVDPYGGQKAFLGLAVADIILITDIHGDHMNPKTLSEIATSKAQIVVPQAVADKLPTEYKDQLVILDNGSHKKVKGIDIEAIPMYNLPEDSNSRHTKGRGNGYILTMGGKRVYISGDTEDIPEMRALKNIDVAFVCMNLPYTMDINQAASAVIDFKPEIMYPYHYRGTGGLADVEAFKKLVHKGFEDTDVRLRDWYPDY